MLSHFDRWVEVRSYLSNKKRNCTSEASLKVITVKLLKDLLRNSTAKYMPKIYLLESYSVVDEGQTDMNGS